MLKRTPIAAMLALCAMLLAAGGAQAQGAAETKREPITKDKLNTWTIGLAAGRIEGAPLRLAAQLAQALDEGDSMRVLPIVSRGPFDNMYDLLYLRGIDMAIVYGDVLEHFRTKERVPGLLERVNYIARLFPAEIHLLVRPEINSLKDLEGKRVNINTSGTAANYIGPIIFGRLGVKAILTTDPHRGAIADMKKAESKYSGLLFVSTKPFDALKADWPKGYKLLPIELNQALEEYYVPTYLENSDYPKLIPQGERVSTIAVPVILAIYNWQPSRERYRRMVRFIDYMFDRLPKLQQPPNDASWKQVNLAANVPGWKRYPPVQAKLDQVRGGAAKK